VHEHGNLSTTLWYYRNSPLECAKICRSIALLTHNKLQKLSNVTVGTTFIEPEITTEDRVSITEASVYGANFTLRRMLYYAILTQGCTKVVLEISQGFSH
jgi:hypothetical protein